MIPPSSADPEALERWEARTRDFLSGQGWDPAGSHLLIAVSGGADSVALLRFWSRAAPRLGCRLSVAHVDHNLRPSSGADAAFVAGLCRDLGLPLRARNLDPGSKAPRESLEMWARRERYRFFTETARAEGADWILTGHHKDDLVETVFQRLGRGTGPRGLKGIPFRRDPGIVRPFLDRSRAEILAYLSLVGAEWREDESNADARIDRNWYRHRYLPALRAREPGLDDRIFAAALAMQAMEKGLDALEEEAGLLAYDAAGVPYLSRQGLADRMAEGDAESLGYWLKRLLRAAARRERGIPEAAAVPLTKELLAEFRRQWAAGTGRMQVDLAAGIALKCENNGIYCVAATAADSAADPAKKSCSPESQRVILVGGHAEVSWRWGERRYTLATRTYARPAELEYPASGGEKAIFDAELFSCTLLIRTRKNGDRFSPLGIGSRSRKLKTFFNEKKVPIGMRDITPIILAGVSSAEGGSQVTETPAWIPGYGISEFFKVSDSTSHILELVLTCQNP